jgi:hypothetical protein
LLERAKQLKVITPLTLWVVRCIECAVNGNNEWMRQTNETETVLPAYECEEMCQAAVNQIVKQRGRHKPESLRVNANDYFDYLDAHPDLAGTLHFEDGSTSQVVKPRSEK